MRRPGYTLVELIIYLGLSGLVLVVTTNFLMQLLGQRAVAATQTSLQENSRTITSMMTVALRNAYDVSVSADKTSVIILSVPPSGVGTLYTGYKLQGGTILSGSADAENAIVYEAALPADVQATVFSMEKVSSALDVEMRLAKGTQSTLLDSTIAFRQHSPTSP